MKIDWLIQKDGNNTIGENIIEAFERKPKKVYAMISELKDSGLEILEEGYIGTESDFDIIVGINKKNTTKIMLESLLRHAENVYVYDNNNEVGFDGNFFIFVYKEVVVVYTYTGDTTESTLSLNNSMYTKVIYDLSVADDKEMYKKLKKNFDNVIKEFEVITLTRDIISKLQAEKKIFTPKIYNHNVKSVAELIAETKGVKKEENKTENIYVENSTNNMINKIDLDLDNFNIDIEFNEDEIVKDNKEEEEISNIEIPEEEYESETKNFNQEDFEEEIPLDEEETVNYEDEDAIDLESMVFGNSKIKIKDEDVKIEDEDEKIISKKIDLSSATCLVMQLPRPSTRGKETNVIKVPNYIKQTMPNFINFNKDVYKEKDGNVEYKYKNIKFSILDVEENKLYEDNNAKLVHKDGQTYIGFSSDVISNVTIKENYIARIMKLDEDEYRCEIVPLDSNEYPVWKKVCNLTFRGSERKYGIM